MLGANGINILMKAAQNALIDRGYTTSRILAEPQDLSQGTLTLTVVPGRIRHINVDQSNIEQTHADRAILFNALPMKQGDILNLRDIEQESQTGSNSGCRHPNSTGRHSQPIRPQHPMAPTNGAIAL